MVCKMCGKDLTSMKPGTISAIDECKNEMRDMPCENLYTEYLSTPMYHRHEAARQLLLERGHSEISGDD